MKTIQDLFELLAQTTEQGNKWFINYSGHVNKISIRYYFIGWNRWSELGSHASTEESIDEKLTDDGIQALYWWVKTRLDK